MFGLHSSLLVINADLISDLTQQHFTVLSPGQDGYADASMAFNSRFTFQPAAIAFPNNAQDVSTVLKIGQKYNHQVVARSGGHSFIANGLGGKDGVVVVDMSNLKQISVDPSSFISTIGTGNRLGDVALGLNNAGRALPHGTRTYVGIGGHSGHGGGCSGKLAPLPLFLKLITLTSFALRGSSSSFGIVTSIQVETFAAPPSTTIFEYNWDLSAADAAKATDQFQKYVLTNIPQEFGAALVLGKGSSSGRVAFGLRGGWYAPADQFNNFIAPLLSTLPIPSKKNITVGTYIDSDNV